MHIKNVKFCKLILICIILISVFTPSFVYATDQQESNTETSEGNGSGASEAFKSALKDLLGREPSDDDIHTYSLMISTLKADGLNTNSIAGVLGNIACESGGKLYTLEGYQAKKTVDGKYYSEFQVGGTYDYGDTKGAVYTTNKGGHIYGIGHGLVGWSFGRADALNKFAEENSSSFGCVTVTHWKWCDYHDVAEQKETCHIPSIAGQVAFMITELNSSSYASVKSSMQSASDEKEAARIFMKDYEAPGTDTTTERENAATLAVPVINACDGVVGDSSNPSGGDSQSSEDGTIGQFLVTKGVWSESQLSNFNELLETPLVMSDSSSLTVNEMYTLNNWKNTVDSDLQETVLVTWMRRIVTWLGILFTLWMIFLYVAYWFDRVNVFFEFSLLEIISLGRLRVSPEEDKCTWQFSELIKAKSNAPMTVNNRAMLEIVIIGCIFGGLIISGVLFKVVRIIVIGVLKFLKIVI